MYFKENDTLYFKMIDKDGVVQHEGLREVISDELEKATVSYLEFNENVCGLLPKPDRKDCELDNDGGFDNYRALEKDGDFDEGNDRRGGVLTALLQGGGEVQAGTTQPNPTLSLTPTQTLLSPSR